MDDLSCQIGWSLQPIITVHLLDCWQLISGYIWLGLQRIRNSALLPQSERTAETARLINDAIIKVAVSLVPEHPLPCYSRGALLELRSSSLLVEPLEWPYQV